jgi:hypothetical protein
MCRSAFVWCAQTVLLLFAAWSPTVVPPHFYSF